jgi:hypothetical protein
MAISLVAYAVVGVFVLSERFLRQGQEALSLKPFAEDRGTTRLVVAAYGASIDAGLIAPVLCRHPKRPRGCGRGWVDLADHTGDRLGIARILEGFGSLVAEHEPVRAVRLAGSAAALRATLGTPLLPSERADMELSSARRCLP